VFGSRHIGCCETSVRALGSGEGKIDGAGEGEFEKVVSAASRPAAWCEPNRVGSSLVRIWAAGSQGLVQEATKANG
jgi:hypothetical protein